MNLLGWLGDKYEVAFMGYPEQDRINSIESDCEWQIRD